MKNLRHYLNDAKDYLDGDGVQRLLEYYQLHDNEIEAVWRDKLSSYENYTEFCELVEKYGLYVFVDDECSWKPTSIFTSHKKEIEFGLRIFNFYDHKVGVLKCTNLPNTAV